jgi:hypothetical protein
VSPPLAGELQAVAAEWAESLRGGSAESPEA